MSELRHWSADGATEAERALLEASRNERPDAASRGRTLAALVGASVVGAATSASATATATAGASLLLKIVGVVVVAGGVGAGAVLWRGSRVAATPSVEPAAAVAPARVAPSAPPVAVSPSAAAPPDSPADEASAAPSVDAAPPVRAPAPRSTSSASLTGEVAALERAHKALAANDPAAAARELERYHAKYPQGSLASEETVLRVQSLLARKENAKAVALAEAFCAAHPDSPYASRVRELVRGKKKVIESPASLQR